MLDSSSSSLDDLNLQKEDLIYDNKEEYHNSISKNQEAIEEVINNVNSENGIIYENKGMNSIKVHGSNKSKAYESKKMYVYEI